VGSCFWRRQFYEALINEVLGLVLGIFGYNCVLILSNGVTANRDSVAPAKKPAITVAGPDTVPSADASIVLY
jgi:hypothetical protein